MNSDRLVCFGLLLMIIMSTLGMNIYINNPFISIKKSSDKTKKEIDNKEVFHISDNVYTYDDATKVCKKYNAKLATREQIEDAYNKGANWCSYGWSANGEAYYPIQKDFYDNLDKNDKHKCGKPGINGGKFDDTTIQFGANCYGVRPSKDEIDKKDDIAPFNSNAIPNSKLKIETFMVNDKRVPIYMGDDDLYHPALF